MTRIVAMKKYITFFVLFICALYACTQNQSVKTADHNVDSIQMLERGKYLVNAMGCDDCHSPKKMGAQGPEIIEELRFSGYQASQQLPASDTDAIAKGWALFNADLTAAIGSWGTTYAANISGHETGIGTWSEKQFFNAIRNGKYKGMDGSRMLLPPMPWQNYAKLNDTDIKAIYTFLKSTKGVDNIVPMAKINSL